MKRYSYTVLLGISMVAAALWWGGKTIYDRINDSEKNPPVNTESISGDVSQVADIPADTEAVSATESLYDTESGLTPPLSSEEDLPPEIFTATTEYFDDALFIGDSRTVGLSEYGDLGNADVFANSGMSVFKIFETELAVDSEEEVTLEELLTQKQYGKIYIMLGINELGYPFESIMPRYQSVVEKIREMQPSAFLFLGANMHVTKGKSAESSIYNNEKINELNQSISELADDKTIFYIDINEVFDDAEGNLDQQYTVDNSHVLGKYYADWVNWILEQARRF